MSEFLEYVQSIQGQILSLSWEHVELTLFSVILAIAIGVPLGILISYLKKLTKPVLGIANIVQAIPSLALLGLQSRSLESAPSRPFLWLFCIHCCQLLKIRIPVFKAYRIRHWRRLRVSV